MREDDHSRPRSASDEEPRQQDNPWWKEVWLGLTRPCLPALAIALGLAGVLCGLAYYKVLTLGPEAMASRLPEYLATGPLLDERCYICGEALALYLNRIPQPDILIYGTSSLRQGTGDCVEIAEVMAQSIGVRPKITNFCSGGLHMSEIELLAAHLPSGFEGIVVISVSPQLFARKVLSLKQLMGLHRWAFPSEPLGAYARRYGLEEPQAAGNYFLVNKSFFLLRVNILLYNAAVGKFPPRKRAYLMPPRIKGRPMSEWRWNAESLMKELRDYEKNSDAQLSILRRVLDHIRTTTKAHVLLVEAPMNPQFIANWPGVTFYNDYLKRIRDFADRENVEFLDLNAAANFLPDEFVDAFHLITPSGTKRCQHELAGRLIEIWKRRLDRNKGLPT